MRLTDIKPTDYAIELVDCGVKTTLELEHITGLELVRLLYCADSKDLLSRELVRSVVQLHDMRKAISKTYKREVEPLR